MPIKIDTLLFLKQTFTWTLLVVGVFIYFISFSGIKMVSFSFSG